MPNWIACPSGSNRIAGPFSLWGMHHLKSGSFWILGKDTIQPKANQHKLCFCQFSQWSEAKLNSNSSDNMFLSWVVFSCPTDPSSQGFVLFLVLQGFVGLWLACFCSTPMVPCCPLQHWPGCGESWKEGAWLGRDHIIHCTLYWIAAKRASFKRMVPCRRCMPCQLGVRVSLRKCPGQRLQTAWFIRLLQHKGLASKTAKKVTQQKRGVVGWSQLGLEGLL